MESLSHSSKILIVGAGCFGISTALHLLKRGYVDVTVIDRAPELPAVDAASTDFNKIVRSSYEDPYYAKLAHDAIALWKNRDEWGDTYHESGCVVISDAGNNDLYINDLNIGARVREITDTEAMKAAFPPTIPLGTALTSPVGQTYINYDGGWAEATKGVTLAIDKVKALGAKVLPGHCVASLLKTNGKTSGVECTNGVSFAADVVIIATGAWTASTFPELRLEERCRATGQSIATIQLTDEEAERYRACPVVLDFGPSEFYMFPPNDKNVFKVARHAAGYANYVIKQPDGSPISVPRTVLSHGTEGLSIPKEAAALLKTSLAAYYPELAEKPFTFTRLCWYTDSPDADWIIDIHPSDPALMIMTAGSGHGYKFLPIIGTLAVDRLEGKMSTELQKKLAVDRSLEKDYLPRSAAKVKNLDPADLVSVKDLL